MSINFTVVNAAQTFDQVFMQNTVEAKYGDIINFLMSSWTVPHESIIAPDFQQYGLKAYKNSECALDVLTLRAELLVFAAKENGLQEHHLPVLLKKALEKKPLGKSLDPLVVFVMLNALHGAFAPGNLEYTKLQAFKDMARAVMSAPFMRQIPSHLKDNKGSMAFFKKLGSCKNTGLNFNPVPGVVVDDWCNYFHDKAFEKIPAGIDRLYYFYIAEAEWLLDELRQNDHKQFWQLLEHKLSYDGVAYDKERFTQLEGQFNSRFSDVPQVLNDAGFSNFLENECGLFEIIDKDIYWHLMGLVPVKDTVSQQRFWQLMVENGANPLTILDNAGLTPLMLAQRYQCSFIANQILLRMQHNANNTSLLQQNEPGYVVNSVTGRTIIRIPGAPPTNANNFSSFQ